MNDKLSPIQQELLMRADSIFKALGEAATKAYDVAGTQIPDMALQYVMYGRAYLTTTMLLGLLALYASYKATIKWFYVSEGLVVVPAGIVTMVSLYVLAFIANSFFLVWFAPKIWLIKELVHLVK